jgi:mono/diheme cytochrome c family protein
VLLAITDGGKLGLALAAGALIAFALLSSFYFSRRNPNFPGDRLGVYIAVTVLLFSVLMAGVIVFANEHKEEVAAETETTATETGESPGTTTGAGEADGNAGDGEEVFASAGCGGCHTLKAAGATGAVGPNLDDAKPDAALVVERVTNGSGVMPPFGDQFSEQQIKDVAAYVVASTQG